MRYGPRRTPQISPAAAPALSRWRRASEPPSTTSQKRAGTMNDSAVIRVRQAPAAIAPTRMAFFGDGSRRHLTNAHAEKTTIAMNKSSRQPSTDHEITSYSIANKSETARPAARDTTAAARRYAAIIVSSDPVADAKLTAASWFESSHRNPRVSARNIGSRTCAW